ncbi:outer membrane beta-barrel protein [Nibribacter ruber]|uniref:Outer membrane beta-barrel protein n=1 Tax=Nibribacter ruber TaxID=2698458 RepID=A0A6P1NZG1_9BACT|nr:porin family protein [Nibribacter ruber]QHL87649.1 outer membrane beta-barrel protein [Nibribacter ruber]
MKNLVFTLLLVAGSFICSQAQVLPGSVQIGIIGGPSHVYFDRDEYPYGNVTISSAIRWSAGLSSKYQLNWFFLKTEPLYENKGYKAEAVVYKAQTRQEFKDSRHFHYLTLPVLVGVRLFRTGFYLNAGPYMGKLLSQITFESVTGSEDTSARREETNSWEKFDYGISGGVGYSKEIHPLWNVSAEIRHNRGLYDIYTGGNYNPNSTSLLLGVHYKLTP